MKNIIGLVLVGSFVAVTGCSKWSQDPMAGQNELLKSPQETPKTPEKPGEATPSDSVKVDTVDFFSFKEGEAGEFAISARVLRADYTSLVSIENMDEFPGAQFNPATGKLTWTVPVGTVPRGGDDRMVKSMKVVAYGIDAGGNKKFYGQKMIAIYIDKLVGVPTIQSSTKNSDSVREGDDTEVVIRVVDADAGISSDQWPTVLVMPTAGRSNLASRVSVEKTTRISATEFDINLHIDLTEGEFTSSIDETGFDVMALSKSGKASAPVTVYMTVFTSLGDLKSTWFEPLEVSNNRTTTYSFVIFDPKEEAALSTPTFDNLPSEITVNCPAKYMSRFAQNCTMKFTPTANTKLGDVFYVRAIIQMKNTSYKDNYVRTQRMNFNLKVGAI